MVAHITETVVAAALVGFFVWIWTIYNRTQSHGASLRDVKDDIVDLKTKQASLETRLRLQEDLSLEIKLEMKRLPKIDEKIDRLLSHKAAREIQP